MRFLRNKTAGKVYYIFFTFTFSVGYNKSLLVLKKLLLINQMFVRKQIVVTKLFFVTEKKLFKVRYFFYLFLSNHYYNGSSLTIGTNPMTNIALQERRGVVGKPPSTSQVYVCV
jgi:hypothetical protein